MKVVKHIVALWSVIVAVLLVSCAKEPAETLPGPYTGERLQMKVRLGDVSAAARRCDGNHRAGHCFQRQGKPGLQRRAGRRVVRGRLFGQHTGGSRDQRLLYRLQRDAGTRHQTGRRDPGSGHRGGDILRRRGEAAAADVRQGHAGIRLGEQRRVGRPNHGG